MPGAATSAAFGTSATVHPFLHIGVLRTVNPVGILSFLEKSNQRPFPLSSVVSKVARA